MYYYYQNEGFTDPSDYEIAGSLWYDITDAATITQSGGLIDAVANKFSGTNALSASGSDRFTYTASGHNSTPQATGVNKKMTAASGLTGVTAETIFLVYQNDSTTGSLEYVLGGNAAAYKVGLDFTTTPPSFLWTTKGSTKTTQALRDVSYSNYGTGKTMHILELCRSQAQNFIEALENGWYIGRDLHSDGSFDTRIEIGGQGTSRANMAFKEFIYYPSALTSAQRSNIRNYLIDKHAIELAPSWTNTYNDAVKRYALANDKASAAAMTEEIDLFMGVGDSNFKGRGVKSSYNAANVALFSDNFIYDWNLAALTNTNWLALDSRDAASRNDQGNTQGTMSMHPVVSRLLKASTGKDAYCLTYANNGATAADTGTGSPANHYNPTVRRDNLLYRFERFYLEAMDELVIKQGRCPTDRGILVSLGVNDMELSTYYNVFQTNLGNIVQSLETLPGRTGTIGKTIMLEQWSGASTYANGLTPVRTALDAVVAARSNSRKIGASYSSDTYMVDGPNGTHYNHVAYEGMASEAVTIMTA